MSKSHPPPEYHEGLSWVDYKKEIKIWQALTTLAAEKQGSTLYLSLKGKAREAALEIDIDQIKGAYGVKAILDKLDKLFLEDANHSAYLAYQKFETFKRPEQIKIKDHQMILPVLACRVLNSKLI